MGGNLKRCETVKRKERQMRTASGMRRGGGEERVQVLSIGLIIPALALLSSILRLVKQLQIDLIIQRKEM